MKFIITDDVGAEVAHVDADDPSAALGRFIAQRVTDRAVIAAYMAADCTCYRVIERTSSGARETLEAPCPSHAPNWAPGDPPVETNRYRVKEAAQ